MLEMIRCGNKQLDLNEPRIMGILNVTPDSFSDGGLFIEPKNALEQSRRMVGEGAAIIDVGGESTRPGAQPVSLQQELDRVMPVIEVINAELDTIISIDTTKPEVMQAAVKAGAHIINDVSALRAEGALTTAAALNVPVCLMHMQGEPRVMQLEPHYDNVVSDIKEYLEQRIEHCLQAGIHVRNIIIDPGFGFGKTVAHNFSLMKHLNDFVKMGYPVLIGVSRKSMIGAILDVPADRRVFAGVALVSHAFQSGVRLFRVHDVKATADALMMCQAVHNAE